jgi:hypothetical protein
VRITGQVLACIFISALCYAVCIACCFVMKTEIFSSEVTRGYTLPLFLLMINCSVTKCVSCVSFEISSDWNVWVVFTLTLPLLCVDYHKVTATVGFKLLFLFVYFFILSRTGCPKIFRKNVLKILGARKSAKSKFRSKERHILDATGQHEVRATLRPRFVNPCFMSAYRLHFMLIKCATSKVGVTDDI